MNPLHFSLLVVFLQSLALALTPPELFQTVTLDDNSTHSAFGWKISSDWFQYSNDGSKSPENLNGIDLTPLDLKSKHGLWLLKNGPHPTKTLEDAHESNAHIEYRSTAQLNDIVEIVACLHGKSYLNVTANSHIVTLRETCANNVEHVQWRTYRVSLDHAGGFRIDAVAPEKKDFIFVDKITASRHAGILPRKFKYKPEKIEDITKACE